MRHVNSMLTSQSHVSMSRITYVCSYTPKEVSRVAYTRTGFYSRWHGICMPHSHSGYTFNRTNKRFVKKNTMVTQLHWNKVHAQFVHYVWIAVWVVHKFRISQNFVCHSVLSYVFGHFYGCHCCEWDRTKYSLFDRAINLRQFFSSHCTTKKCKCFQ